jgi:plastocyanin
MGSLSGDPTQAPGLGEWHTHCHIPDHMMNGMMGSLLIVNQGTFIKGLLQWGVPHVELDGGHDGGHDGGQPPTNTVTVDHRSFEPHDLTVPSGTQVTFDFREINHTVVTGPGEAINADPISINNGSGDRDAVSPVPQTRVVTVTGNSGGQITYHCGIHGPDMNGVIHISNNGGHGGGHAGGH